MNVHVIVNEMQNTLMIAARDTQCLMWIKKKTLQIEIQTVTATKNVPNLRA